MEFIALRPKITKEYILSKINQESIMQYYTKQDVNSKKLFHSVLRQDNHVTVSYYKSKSGILYMHDFATNEHLDCWNVVMRMYNCNYYQALDIIAKDFGLVEGTSNQIKADKLVPEIKKTNSAKIQIKSKDFTQKELDWWNQFGISSKLLKKYHVYSVEYVFLNDELRFASSESCPIFGYYFGKDKNHLEYWKIYFPTNKEKGIRFINNLPTKKLQGYKQLPDSGNLLIITKSLKDCISLQSFGLNAVAPSSESTFVNDKQLEEFKTRFKYILVVYDQDKAGKYNMAKIRRKYPELNYFVIPKEFGCKDFSDLVKMYGVQKTKELLQEFLTKYKFK